MGYLPCGAYAPNQITPPSGEGSQLRDCTTKLLEVRYRAMVLSHAPSTVLSPAPPPYLSGVPYAPPASTPASLGSYGVPLYQSRCTVNKSEGVRSELTFAVTG